MDSFLQTLDRAVREMIADDTMQKHGIPDSIEGIEDLPVRTYAELLDNVRSGNAIVTQGLQHSAVVFSIIATPIERLVYKMALHGPYVVTFTLIILAFVLRAYWLLLAVTFPFVSILLTGPHFPLKANAFPGALVLVCVGLAHTSLVSSLFFGGYAICHLLVALCRGTYAHVLFQRAFALESVFILLYSGGYILVRDRRREKRASQAERDFVTPGTDSEDTVAHTSKRGCPIGS